jgi:ABC-type transport system substrate-binding protein
MQARHIHFDQYTHLMSQREKYGYEVYHLYSGDRSPYVISPNINLRVEPDKPETKKKHDLLSDKRFRQALSLAINRKKIIKAEYNNQTEPAQAAPGPSSFFFEPSLYKAFVEYDPGRANELLDEIGISQRDMEGYRTFKDGSRMTFFFYFTSFVGGRQGQFVVDDWRDVGVRVILREQGRRLFGTESWTRRHDFSVWTSNSEVYPLAAPRYFVPINNDSPYAMGYGRWYGRGGLYGQEGADADHGCIEPPVGHPIREAMELFEETAAQSDPEIQRSIFSKVLKIAAENVWSIGISTSPPVLTVVKNGFRNVPRSGVYCYTFASPGNLGVETFFFDKPYDSPGAIAQIKNSITTPKLSPASQAEKEVGSTSGDKLGALVRYSFLALFNCLRVIF